MRNLLHKKTRTGTGGGAGASLVALWPRPKYALFVAMEGVQFFNLRLTGQRGATPI